MYLKGSQVDISQLYDVLMFLRNDFTLTNSVDPDEIPHYAAFNQDLHCLSMYPFRGFQYYSKS